MINRRIERSYKYVPINFLHVLCERKNNSFRCGQFAPDLKSILQTYQFSNYYNRKNRIRPSTLGFVQLMFFSIIFSTEFDAYILSNYCKMLETTIVLLGILNIIRYCKRGVFLWPRISCLLAFDFLNFYDREERHTLQTARILFSFSQWIGCLLPYFERTTVYVNFFKTYSY